MDRIAKLVIPLVGLVLLSGPVAAEEIIYFTSGSSMPIRAHEIRGEMIHVDLGGDGFMAFPRAMVDRIEEAGRNVLLDSSRRPDANVMSPGAANVATTHPVRGVSRLGGPDVKVIKPEENPDPLVETDANGIAVYRPQKFSRSSAKRQLGAYGHQRARGTASDVRGTTRVGSRYVIGTHGPRRSTVDDRPPIVPIGRADATAPPPPASSGESGDSGASDN